MHTFFNKQWQSVFWIEVFWFSALILIYSLSSYHEQLWFSWLPGHWLFIRARVNRSSKAWGVNKSTAPPHADVTTPPLSKRLICAEALGDAMEASVILLLELGAISGQLVYFSPKHAKKCPHLQLSPPGLGRGDGVLPDSLTAAVGGTAMFTTALMPPETPCLQRMQAESPCSEIWHLVTAENTQSSLYQMEKQH